MIVSTCNGQFVARENSDLVFFKASSNFLNNEIDSAEFNFRKAFEGYRLVDNRKRMNECSMGLASLEFLRGNYEKAMELFKIIRNDHSVYSPTDHERLMLIDQNIMACGEKLRLSDKERNRLKQ